MSPREPRGLWEVGLGPPPEWLPHHRAESLLWGGFTAVLGEQHRCSYTPLTSKPLTQFSQCTRPDPVTGRKLGVEKTISTELMLFGWTQNNNPTGRTSLCFRQQHERRATGGPAGLGEGAQRRTGPHCHQGCCGGDTRCNELSLLETLLPSSSLDKCYQFPAPAPLPVLVPSMWGGGDGGGGRGGGGGGCAVLGGMYSITSWDAAVKWRFARHVQISHPEKGVVLPLGQLATTAISQPHPRARHSAALKAEQRSERL